MERIVITKEIEKASNFQQIDVIKNLSRLLDVAEEDVFITIQSKNLDVKVTVDIVIKTELERGHIDL